MREHKVHNNELYSLMIRNQREAEETYKEENPTSKLFEFEEILKKLGYEFEILDQVRNFLPKHRMQIIPLAIELYKDTDEEFVKRYFLTLFHYKGFEECIPAMLEDLKSEKISKKLKSSIAETLRAIRSPMFCDDYVNILLDVELGDARNAIISLVGSLKIEKAIPGLIAALDEGKNITTNALSALGNYRNPELAEYFEKYINHENKYYRKEAEKALKKIKNKNQ